MATTAAAVTPPPLTAEVNHAAVSPSPQQPQEFSPIANHSSDAPQSYELETLPLAVASPPPFINSIGELKDLSAAILAFQQCYDDLHNHLDSIKAAITSKLPLEPVDVTSLVPSVPCGEKIDVSEGRELQERDPNPQVSELESLCKTMCSRGVRRYLSTHLSDLAKLREEVPKALKLAPNAPKLVLECLGKFYLQGKKAFTRNSPMIPARDASILILECFLLMMGMDVVDENDNGVMDIEKTVREEAETAALAWRKRLMSEGRVAEASQVDARGLLLFVACFGIPAKFKREDIRDLVIAGNAKEILGVLQKSHLLMNKIPEIVDWMVKHKLEVDAVDVACTFGLEEKFNPQSILVSFLRESKESWKKQKKASQGPASLNEANKKQLAALRSIKKCLARHKIDPSKLLPGWQINEKIATLEKDIANSNRKPGENTAHKRKANEPETSNKSKTQEPKRSRYSGHGPPQHGHADNRRNLLDSGHPSHHASNNYSGTPSVVYGGPGAGLLPESMVPSGVGAGISTTHSGIHSTGSYGGVHGGFTVDAAGQIINRSAHPYSYHADAALIERYAGQQPSSIGLTSLYRASTSSVEGFAGVPNASSVGVGGRGSASDLYQFADSVAESESYPGAVARGVGGVPSTHHSSYLYQV
ncbi:hypothetical protein BUALT_Bualt07G0107800 [Buddleja alternifolia]|uniref:FRIGIDA-like protein n=1 Tax=Buddleja alternifolia TaxID=168488 RepID=A0AAV6XKJ3_9LAMI|nr:hypothetical protein BUALT_Bualt07G0107000 [Buddleja alternifolia]KAG8379621.1 hypothetical protein BUALT_Bualt07G0107800 [Buddleja alternifolia]